MSPVLLLAVLVTVGWLTPRPVHGQESEPAETSVLIRNVHILKRSIDGESIEVHLILRGKMLDLVTEEKVARDAADLVLDAKGGFLLGKLRPGSPPSFIVLSEDPRLDFGVLLDTDRYTTLAVREGEIIRNWLLPSADEDVQEGTPEPKKSGWLAYTPPPIALPLDYDLSTKWNAWDNDWTSGAFLGALAVDRLNWTGQDAGSETQVGDLSAFDGGEIRALRFGVIGSINLDQPWGYTVFLATRAFDKGFDTREDDNLTVFDMRLDIPVSSGMTLSLGKQKEPISAERLSSGLFLPLQERSVGLDGLLPARNTGAVLSGGALDRDMSWAVGIFNNWMEQDGNLADNSTQYVARVTGLPAYSADESNLLHLGLGFRYSNAQKGLGYRTTPEFDNSPNFIDTGFFDADASMTYDVEAAWLRGPFWLFAEYISTRADAPAFGDPTLRGHSVTAVWNLTGEMRGYNRRSGVFQPFRVSEDVDVGGLGAWEAAVRWSSLNTNSGALTGGDIDIYSIGFNWWLSSSMVASMNYRWMKLDRDGEIGESHGVLGRLLLILD